MGASLRELCYCCLKQGTRFVNPSQYQQLRSSVCFLPYLFEKDLTQKNPLEDTKRTFHQAVYEGILSFWWFGPRVCRQNHRSLHQKFGGDYIRWLWMRWVFLGQPCRPHGLEYIWCFVCLKTYFLQTKQPPRWWFQPISKILVKLDHFPR